MGEQDQQPNTQLFCTERQRNCRRVTAFVHSNIVVSKVCYTSPAKFLKTATQPSKLNTSFLNKYSILIFQVRYSPLQFDMTNFSLMN